MIFQKNNVILAMTMALSVALAAWYAAPRLSARAVTESPDDVPVAVREAPTMVTFLSALRESQILSLSFVYATNEAIASNAEKRFVVLEAQLYGELEQHSRNPGSEQERGLLVQAKESLDNYVQAVREAMDFKKSGSQKMAEAVLYGNVGPYESELEQILVTLAIEKKRAGTPQS